jgi:hypothetical protein
MSLLRLYFVFYLTWLLGTAQQHWTPGQKVQAYWLARKGSSRDQAASQQHKLAGQILPKQIMEAPHLFPERKKAAGVHPEWNGLTVPRQHYSTSVLSSTWRIGLTSLTVYVLSSCTACMRTSFALISYKKFANYLFLLQHSCLSLNKPF